MGSLMLLILFPFLAQTQEISDYEKLVEAATVLADNNAYKKAINSLDKAIEMDSLQFLAYYERGKVKYKMDAYEAAVIDLEKVSILKPSFYFSYVYIADCKMKLGDFKGAKESYQQALDYNNEYKFYSKISPKYRQAKLAEMDQTETILDPELMEVYFIGQTIVLGTGDILTCSETTSSKNKLKSESQLLDVNFSMSDEPVENGFFVFGMETENDKNLTLELFEEKTGDLLMQCTFVITEGNNYKALNLSHLASGTYAFIIYDENEKELYRILSIE
jgi:tetratricopeptide (TPR) repeat protein